MANRVLQKRVDEEGKITSMGFGDQRDGLVKAVQGEGAVHHGGHPTNEVAALGQRAVGVVHGPQAFREFIGIGYPGRASNR